MKKVSVTIGGDGFAPSSITAKKGEPLMLEFTRVTDQTYAKKVVSPCMFRQMGRAGSSFKVGWEC